MNQLRVLVIDDSEEDAELLRLELERGGRPVRMQRIETEPELLAALKHKNWDVIVSDYAMPKFDGLKAFALYRESNIDVPFIFVSGALGEERAVRAMIAGARDYILKGNLGRLNAAVDREVAEAKSRKARREAEAANARERRRLAVALHATGAGVFEFNIPDDGQGYCSGRLAEILGCSVHELRSFDSFSAWLLRHVHPQDLEQIEGCYQNLLQSRESNFAVEFRLRHEDGGWRDMWWVAEAAEVDSCGNVTNLVGVVLDRTEHRLMEEQLRQAQKMEAVGRLAGGIAHDFNNLLTVILNFGQFVLAALKPATTTRDDMQEVVNAARRAEKLTNKLLAFSRSQRTDPRIVNVNGLIEGVDKMLRQLLGADVQFRTSLAPDLWQVHVDPGCIEQVIVNLCINARDAMPDGGTLSVTTRNIDFEGGSNSTETTQVLGGQHVSISVSDNGIGMDAETKRRSFEPFFTTKEPSKGTGRGLATCYGIVQQAGGSIQVDSEPGSGSTFDVLLPRSRACSDASREPQGKPEERRGSEVILVVEDDLAVRKLIDRILTQLGYVVLMASNGLDALQIVRSGPKPVHLVLTDIVMPKMSGPKLMEELAPHFPGLKVLFMSGYTGSDFVADIDDPALLRKPFSPQVLASRLREVLDA